MTSPESSLDFLLEHQMVLDGPLLQTADGTGHHSGVAFRRLS